ncbi:MAG: hypothetical protein K2X29_07070 [Candidatus Obscuribacterales bacterium]|nr:hypothetical protein [Candidatus Obscuribacterales bacterium]
MEINVLASILAFLAAAAGWLMQSSPRMVKTTGVIASGLIFVILVTRTFFQSVQIETIMSTLIGAAAFVCILSQQLIRHAEKPIILIFIVAGFSFSYLNVWLPEPITTASLGVLLGSLFLFSLKDRRDNPLSTGAAVVFAVALLCLILSSVFKGSLSTVLLFATAAALLPLFPLHAAFVGSLSGYADTFRAYLAVVLPCLGWYTIVARSSAIPQQLGETVMVLAVIGAIVSTIRASVQIDLARTFASIGTILLSLAWLSIGSAVQTCFEITGYVMSVAVVTSGLLLCAHQLESRYGTQLREDLRGLAQPMPRLSILLGVLILAAAGFPPFSLFTMLMAMILTSNQLHILFIASAVSLACSLLLVAVMQQLLFGARRSDLVYEDLGNCDVIALSLVALVLMTGGVLPYMVTRNVEVTRIEKAHMVANNRLLTTQHKVSRKSVSHFNEVDRVFACQIEM